ncbi:MAG: hypothetical protein FJ194_03570 [Gammaproteobacteria bacterium]|nr:hypothetical protein [Gammaproteobacteria bacterium]
MSFRANALRMVAGTLVAHALPVLATPFLTRSYDPEAFGLQLLFMSLATALGVLATCRLELAIVMAPSDDEGHALAGIILLLTTIICGAQVFVLAGFAADIALLTDHPDRTGWLWMLPVFTFLLSLFQVSLAFASRRDRFGQVAAANATNQGAYVLVALSSTLGGTLGGPTVQGLVSAKFVGQLTSALFSVVSVRSDWLRTNPIHVFSRAGELLRKNVQFLAYNTPYSLSGGLLRDVPVFFLSTLSSTALTGYFALARMITMAPAALVSSAISPVFFREAAAHRGTSYLQSITLRLLNSGAVATAPVFALAAVWGDHLFVFAFGEGWMIAGQIAMLLSPAAWWAVQTAWPERLFEVHGRQGVSLTLQLVADVATAAAFVGVLLLAGDPLWAVAAFAFCNLIYHHAYVFTVCAVSSFETRAVFKLFAKAWLMFLAWIIALLAVRWISGGSLGIGATATVVTLGATVLMSRMVYRALGQDS